MNKKTHQPHLGKRESNLIKGLEDGPKTSRELMDIIPTNNPSVYIGRINQLGYCTHTQRVSRPDSSGEFKRHGLYHLLPDCNRDNLPPNDE